MAALGARILCGPTKYAWVAGIARFGIKNKNENIQKLQPYPLFDIYFWIIFLIRNSL